VYLQRSCAYEHLRFLPDDKNAKINIKIFLKIKLKYFRYVDEIHNSRTAYETVGATKYISACFRR
jgi:hypothetical protein